MLGTGSGPLVWSSPRLLPRCPLTGRLLAELPASQPLGYGTVYGTADLNRLLYPRGVSRHAVLE